jgi:predicted amidohydrolase
MRELRVAAAQFEAQDDGKKQNLEAIARLSKHAAGEGAELVVFHECSVSGYTYLEGFSREELLAQAELVPKGHSVKSVLEIARDIGISIGAGLIEREGEQLFNCYFVVSPEGFVAKHRKIHAFINENLSCGDRFTVFDHLGAKIGILTCYDNNLPENVRITAMMGAEMILMPHVTGCLPSPMPGRGPVDPAIWENRERDPARCRQEFDGPKGRGWLLRWLPARAFENGVYAIYSNPIGLEGGTIKPGGSMILDPFGEIIGECRKLGEDVVVALLDPAKLEQASGRGYIRARRPDLYGKLLEPNPHLGPGGRPDVWWKRKKRAVQPSS